MSAFDLLPSLALGAFGLLFLAIGLWARSLNLRAATWPSVMGEVIESSIDRTTLEPGWSARVRYRYSVDGREHESRQISFKVRSASAAAEKKLVAAYPLGQSVRVYYDPLEPQTAVLEREPSYGWAWFVALGLLCLVGAALIPLIPTAPRAA